MKLTNAGSVCGQSAAGDPWERHVSPCGPACLHVAEVLRNTTPPPALYTIHHQRGIVRDMYLVFVLAPSSARTLGISSVVCLLYANGMTRGWGPLDSIKMAAGPRKTKA